MAVAAALMLGCGSSPDSATDANVGANDASSVDAPVGPTFDAATIDAATIDAPSGGADAGRDK